MFLSDATILKLIEEGKIVFKPKLEEKNIRPAGIRLHLGADILIPKPDQTIDITGNCEVAFEKKIMDADGYTLKPGEFILGTTLERFQLPRHTIGMIDGRSTMARLGLSIHCTSSIVDGNFDEPRTVVLEIKNHSPFSLVLKPKAAVAMLVITELTTPIAQHSQSQYHGQIGVEGPNMKKQEQ